MMDDPVSRGCTLKKEMVKVSHGAAAPAGAWRPRRGGGHRGRGNARVRSTAACLARSAGVTSTVILRQNQFPGVTGRPAPVRLPTSPYREDHRK